jgi:hypothetical protein
MYTTLPWQFQLRAHTQFLTERDGDDDSSSSSRVLPNGRSRAAPSRGLYSPLLLPRAEPGFNLVPMIDVPSCTLGPPPRVRCSQAASLTQEPLSTRACTVIWADAFHTHVDRFITSKQEAHRHHCSIALTSFTATTVGKAIRLAPASTSTASCSSIHKNTSNKP